MQAGELRDYQSFTGGLLCSLDGTQYFSSTQIHCSQCTVIVKETGTRYAHTVLIPALVRPGKAEVLVMEPEFIMPQIARRNKIVSATRPGVGSNAMRRTWQHNG